MGHGLAQALLITEDMKAINLLIFYNSFKNNSKFDVYENLIVLVCSFLGLFL